MYLTYVTSCRIYKVSTLGIISSFAGTGVYGSGCDGGPASVATFSSITGLVFDKFGNLYIADGGVNRLRKINTSGIITTIAGTGTYGYTGDNGPATDAEIGGAPEIAVDTSGNIYFPDDVLMTIRKIDTAGIITRYAGNGSAGFSGDGGAATAAQLNDPITVTTDRMGNLYLFDETNYRIRKVDASGIITTISGTGLVGYSGDGGPATAAELDVISGLWVDTFENIYLADEEFSSNCICKIDPSGIITRFAGVGMSGFSGDCGPATAAQLDDPERIARHGNGNIYISDSKNNRIRMIITKPYFINGFLQHITFCHGTLNLDTLLAANDSNTGNTEVWSLVSGPANGTAVVGYTAMSIGSVIYPTGLSYTSTPGYYGPDTLRVRISDSHISDNTTLYLSIQGPPYADIITGPDTVCLPNSITLTDTTAGGAWSSTNTRAMVGTTGIVTGISPGPDTISYQLTNSCGTATAIHPVRVKGCNVEVNTLPAPQGITIAPNPSDGTFTLTIPGNVQPARIIITNLLGQKLKELITATTTQSIQLGSPPGIYFISVTTSGGEWCSKIVVQ